MEIHQGWALLSQLLSAHTAPIQKKLFPSPGSTKTLFICTQPIKLLRIRQDPVNTSFELYTRSV